MFCGFGQEHGLDARFMVDSKAMTRILLGTSRCVQRRREQ
jgi:hypothetical protein